MHVQCPDCKTTTPAKEWSQDAYGMSYSKGQLVCPKCHKRTRIEYFTKSKKCCNKNT